MPVADCLAYPRSRGEDGTRRLDCGSRQRDRFTCHDSIRTPMRLPADLLSPGLLHAADEARCSNAAELRIDDAQLMAGIA